MCKNREVKLSTAADRNYMLNRFINILFLLSLFLITISNTFSKDKNKDSIKSGVKYYGSFTETEISELVLEAG